MNLIKRMNNVLDYIEENLNSEIDVQKIAKISCYSATTFQRMFSIMTDISLSEYIRRRKLTLAAFELQNSDIKIIDIALKYGYDSPEAFARAFHALHNVTPSLARKKGVSLKAYPRLSFQLTLKGDIPLDYKIEEHGAFTVYGIEKIISMADGGNWKSIPGFWSEILENGQFDELHRSTYTVTEDANGLNVINAITCYRITGGDTIPYMIFAFKTEKSKTDKYTLVEIHSSTWAIFKTENHTIQETSNAIQYLTKRIYTDWLPTANYETVEGCELELTYKSGETYYSEKWIRVVAKK